MLEPRSRDGGHISDPDERRKVVQELATAVSTQAQVVNRTWLALMTVALFGVLPRLPAKDSNVFLPFSLGEVDPTSFHTVLFSILVVLTIAFAAAHAQQVRAQMLAQSAVDSMASRQHFDDYLHPWELFDMCRLPSLNRVAPLAQALRGRHQFFAGRRDRPAWIRATSFVYYALLKLASLLVYLGFARLGSLEGPQRPPPGGWAAFCTCHRKCPRRTHPSSRPGLGSPLRNGRSSAPVAQSGLTPNKCCIAAETAQGLAHASYPKREARNN
jgi:hypothetical protein